MAQKQLSRRQKALTIVPLALISGAWTVSLAGFGGSATAAGDDHGNSLPDGTKVPSKAIEAPANVPIAGVIAPGVPRGTADSVVDSASTSGIPSAALSAYQRAAQIIDAADKTCNIPWQLIGAIGRVESDHGRYGGNTLSRNGVSTPGIYGIPLNGKNGTQAIQDTDGGQLDKDQVFDRAVGPMQFIPSTWSAVKVDADGDGKRNPQDIDDASLATAVYLCSGSEDLGTRKGQQSAVYRYNHSKQYVDLVLRIMAAYQSGDYTAVPDAASGGTVFSPSNSTAMHTARAKAVKKQHSNGGSGGSSGGGGGTSGGGTSSGGGGGNNTPGGGGNVPGGGGGGTPTPPVPTSTPTVIPKPVVKTLGQLGQATSFCTSHLPQILQNHSSISECVSKVSPLTKSQALARLPSIIADLKALLPGLPGLP
jgi:membrane-bound lytic murein transglycosylase B